MQAAIETHTHFGAGKDPSNLDVALALARAAIPVFPARCWHDAAKGKWQKEPHVTGWQKVATTDVDRLREWWRQWPEAVRGIPLERTDLFVVDADRHPGGSDGVTA